MQTNMSETVTCKFDDLIHSLNHFSDDLKIACAEASLDGDFSLVTKLSNDSMNTQAFIKDVMNISNRMKNEIIMESSKFAAAEVPLGLSEEKEIVVRKLFDDSFINAFNKAAYAASILCLLGGLMAFVSIRNKEKGSN